MLRGLTIQDMLIIDRLELEFQPGLNVLTGETGAGKSILLDCLGFVLGWRGRAELVRTGAARGEVTADFDLPPNHKVFEILDEADVPHEGELILRRTNAPDGRKTAFINDRRCSGDLLKSVSETLIEMHGQHDDRGLLNVNGHRRLLDDFAQVEGQKQACKSAWSGLRSARKALEAHRAQSAALAEEEDFLRHAAKELSDLAPEPGEADKLDAQRRLMQSAERIRDDMTNAAQVLGGEGAEGALLDGQRWLEGAASKLDDGLLDGALNSVSRAMNELAEAQQAVDGVVQSLAFDASELEQVEERLFTMRGLARKHDVVPDALADLAVSFQARLDLLDNSAGDLDGLQAAVDEAQANYDAAAKALTAARTEAAGRLDKAMAAELAPLKMERAVFATDVTPSDPGPDGVDAVAFRVATNPGAPAGPLNKIASGGELSRFLLALKVCLTGHQSGLTLIFDEIDRGVGGATADAVGRRLASLGQGGQVLVVTHSPQVAALGDAHWTVSKEVRDGATFSQVTRLSDGQRSEEIARMLSGDRVTDAAIAAANALIQAD